MKIASKIILALGLVSMIVGIVLAGLTYRDMKTENLLHARTGIIDIKLAEKTDWKSEDFTLYRPGGHILYLSTVNAFAKPNAEGATSRPAPRYDGQFEVVVHDPDGEVIIQKRVTKDAIDLTLPENISWIVLDTLHAEAAALGIWNIRFRVLEADTAFARTNSEIGILPAQKYDIGWYLYGQTFKLIGFGILGLLGFFLIVLGGYLRRRTGASRIPYSQSA